jgi:hypothetical protein
MYAVTGKPERSRGAQEAERKASQSVPLCRFSAGVEVLRGRR